MMNLKIETAEPAHIQIERHLRRQIEAGILTFGQRLPSTSELSSQWNVHDRAIQKAMKRLTAEGILERSPRRGTFIRAKEERPIIGILVGANLLNEEYRFYRAIVEFIREEIFSRGMDLRVYDRLRFNKTEQTIDIMHKFERDMRSHLFKGLISISASLKIFEPNVISIQLPTVSFSRSHSTVITDNADFIHSALECIVERNRHKIAYIRTFSSFPYTQDVDEFLQFGTSQGLKVGKNDIYQIVPPASGIMNFESTGYTEMIKLMNQWDIRKSWPDALIVSDDVLMKGVALALRERKIKVPEQLLVITDANEGIDYPYLVPVVRIEISPREISQALTRILWEIMRGSKPPSSSFKVNYRVKKNDDICANDGVAIEFSQIEANFLRTEGQTSAVAAGNI